MTFEPDWTVSPGEMLRDWLDENGVTPRLLAAMCRVSRDEIEGVLARTYEITPTLARALASGTGVSGRFWLACERRYRADLAAGKRDVSGE
jgi:plasmid maintenance system antidote protein VapI